MSSEIPNSSSGSDEIVPSNCTTNVWDWLFPAYSIIITYVPGFVVETSSRIIRDKLFPTWKLRTVFLPVGSVTVSIALLPISLDITKLTSTMSPGS